MATNNSECLEDASVFLWSVRVEANHLDKW